MKPFGALGALALMTALAATPAWAARSSYVIDGAAMLSPDTISSINTQVANFNAQTGKEIVVQTVSTTSGTPIRDAAAKTFSDLGVNGVLIFIAKDDRKDFIVPDAAGTRAGWFSPSIFAPMYSAMGAQFKNGDFDAGVTSAVDSILGIYRSHMNSLGGANGAPAPVQQRQNSSYSSVPATGGFHLSMFWLIVLLVVAFLVLRSILRAMAAPRPPVGSSGPPVAPGAPGYGAQGYGPGYGGMGGGGSFFSGLLGGLGGAFLGNELFRGGGGGSLGGGSNDQGGSWSGGNAPSDGGGWSSDAGQADAGGGGGGGDWSGGGFDGGGGDFGGGGGGGDSGGGW
ncbi:MAG: TPM domain-containing protein [Candidatus Baltobacteraceae bacterium]